MKLNLRLGDNAFYIQHFLLGHHLLVVPSNQAVRPVQVHLLLLSPLFHPGVPAEVTNAWN